jgi:hypothetical protein
MIPAPVLPHLSTALADVHGKKESNAGRQARTGPRA